MDISTLQGAQRAQLLARWKYETARRATFAAWPWHDLGISTAEFAKAGFVYLNQDDRVQCVFCLGIVEGWQPGDTPRAKHRENYPHCIFLRGVPVGNVPIGTTEPERLQGLMTTLPTQPAQRSRSLERPPSMIIILLI